MFLELSKEVVGEEELLECLNYIVAGSFVENANPISFHTILNSQSGSGKDYLLNRVKHCLPPIMYDDFTRISPRALDYLHAGELDWDWTGKILFLHDVDDNILNNSTMKVFMSEGSKTAIVDKGIVKNRTIRGRPIIIMSSAFSEPEYEQLRRINIINLNETEEQTKKIMSYHCKKSNNQAETLPYNFFGTKQKSISELKRFRVEIPFSEKLIELVNTNHIYMRTFFPRLLDFVKASCVLNQHWRSINSLNGFLVAEEEDYENVRHVINRFSVGNNFVPLSYAKKQIFKKITEHFGISWFTTKEVESISGVTYEAIRKNLANLYDAGYLESKMEISQYGRPIINYRNKTIEKLQLKSIFHEEK